jgi:hypothetical protein
MVSARCWYMLPLLSISKPIVAGVSVLLNRLTVCA